jgi:gas vesicle protein
MKNIYKILISLGIGAVIGGILGVLFAPGKGTETREKLSEAGKKWKERFNHKVKSEKESYEEAI